MIDPRMKMALATALLTLSAGAANADKTARPELFTKLVACRSITDPTQRLACYDSQVSALDIAEEKNDVVMMDRKQVRETRRSLFGFTLPKFILSGEKADSADEIEEIATTVASTRPLRNGGWSFVLASDGGTWETMDTLTAPPMAGDKIRIRKASLGSYLGAVGVNRGLRFRRVG